MIRISIVLSVFLSYSGLALAEELYGDFPAVINATEHYVFYSHGLIVEGDDPRPVHPDFGTYQFPEIAAALFATGGFNLIAHHRTANTRPEQYVIQLQEWVEELLEAGVAAANITLIGFSRGAQLTLVAAHALNETGINTVIMGVCSDGDYTPEKALRLGGRVLSLYETSDVVQSCSSLLARSSMALATAEIAISTGLQHGAFYTPHPAWLVPLQHWLQTIH